MSGKPLNWKAAGNPEHPSELDASGLAAIRPKGSGPGLLEAAARRDFAQVYEEHFEFVWRSLRLLGVQRDALDDVSQDVFSAVARQLGRFEGRSSLRTWVFGIAQNIASNHRRLRARKLDLLEPLAEPFVSPEPSPHAHTEGREAADAILKFCDGLEESRRTVFVLGLLEGVPAPEIAALLGIPINTVYSRVRTLRDALERHLSEHEVER